jgi:hypothetical protein
MRRSGGAVGRRSRRARGWSPLEQPEASMAADRGSILTGFHDAPATRVRTRGVTLTIGACADGQDFADAGDDAAAAAAAWRFGSSIFRSAALPPDRLFRVFCAWLTDTLELEDRSTSLERGLGTAKAHASRMPSLKAIESRSSGDG